MIRKRFLLAALLAASAAPSVQAQTVVKPRPPLDSTQVRVRDAVLVLRDSLQLVHAGGAHMQRDFRGASSAALVSRARSLRDGCAASARTLPQTRAVLSSGPAPTSQARAARTELMARMDTMAAALAECQTQFDDWVKKDDGEAVRGYGNRSAGAIRAPIRAYESQLQLYLGMIGVRIRPIGAGESPIRS